MTMPEREKFGQVIDRLLGGDISLARLARLADVDYAHLNTLRKGERGGKPIYPSPEIIDRLIPAFEEAGIALSVTDREALYNSSVRLPDGYEVRSSVPTPEDWPEELKEALLKASELTPEVQDFMYRIWRMQAEAQVSIDATRREQVRREAARKLEERQARINRERRGE